MEADWRFQAAPIGAAALTPPQCSNGHSEDLILRRTLLRASQSARPKKEGPPKRALNWGLVSRSRSGGLGIDLAKIVLRGLRTVGDEFAEIFGGGLRPRDEHFAACPEHIGLDLHRFV